VVQQVRNENELINDIESWSNERLKLWAQDTVSRYDIVGLNKSLALSYTVSTMMSGLAYLLASIEADPAEAGRALALAVRATRRKLDQLEQAEKAKKIH
jgi:hypothetical protein